MGNNGAISLGKDVETLQLIAKDGIGRTAAVLNL
jgi:hypothetical protein